MSTVDRPYSFYAIGETRLPEYAITYEGDILMRVTNIPFEDVQRLVSAMNGAYLLGYGYGYSDGSRNLGGKH